MDVTWPSWLEPARFEIRLRPNVQIAVANLSGGVVTSEIPGARWYATVVLPNFGLNEPRFRAVEALFARLRGPANRLLMGHLGHPWPYGTLSGTVLSQGALQGALTMDLAGSGQPEPSDMLTVTTADGAQWVMVDSVVTIPGGCTVTFSPPLRGDVTTGSIVQYENTVTRWIVAGPDVPIPFGQAHIPSIAFDLVEVWN